MLLAIREKVTGVVALVFVAVIALLMVVPLLYDYVVGLGSRDALEIDGDKVSVQAYNQRLSNTRQRLMQAFGNKIPESVDVDSLVKQQTLDAIINDTLLNNATIKDGFRLANAEVERQIMQDPAFMQNGKFDQKLYERQIQAAGYTHNYYKQMFGQQAAQRQLVDGIIDSAFVATADIEKLAQLQNQRRDLDLVELPAAHYRSKIKLSEAELEAYYQSHKQQFQVPEQLIVNYIDLNYQDFKDKVEVSEADIISEYQTGLAAKRYSTPELRSASHILLNVSADKDSDAKVKAEAEALYTKLNNGADFAATAKELSQDSGSAAKGGSLGEVARGVMVPAFENAVYSQPQGVIGKPFKTRFGYHIVRVDSISAAKDKPLAEVRDEIKQLLIANRARSAFDEAVTELSNLADEYPESLKPIAEKMQLPLKSSSAFSREAGEGLFADASVRELAFSDEVLAESHNSEVFAISENNSIILRVEKLIESHSKSFAEARAAVELALTNSKIEELMQADITTIEQQLTQGEPLAKSAAKLGFKVAELSITRAKPADLDQAVVSKIFANAHPSAAKPSFGSAKLADKRVFFVLKAVHAGNSAELDAASREQYRNLLRNKNATADFSALLAELRANAKIWISPQIDNLDAH